MAVISESDIIIENNQASWKIDMLGDIQGLYTGTFTFKCYLSPLEQISANREYRQLLGEHASLAGEHETFLDYALTQLKHRIVKAPPFWASNSVFNGDLPDENIISAVLDAAINAEVKYKKGLKKSKVESLTRAKAIAERIADNAAIDDEVEALDREITSEKDTSEK